MVVDDLAAFETSDMKNYTLSYWLVVCVRNLGDVAVIYGGADSRMVKYGR